MKPKVLVAVLSLAAMFTLSACSNGEPKETEPTFTLGVKPARQIDSHSLEQESIAPKGTVEFEGEWFTVHLPPEASLTLEDEQIQGEDSIYAWTWGAYEITAYMGSAEVNSIEGYESDSVAEAHVLEALYMLDGGEAENLEAGELNGWDMTGYYLTQEYPEAERRVSYYFSDADSFVRFEVTQPVTDSLPYDFMNTFEMKD